VRESVACLRCGVILNSTNDGPLCNLCERKFVAYVAQLPKAKARLTRVEWIKRGGLPKVGSGC